MMKNTKKKRAILFDLVLNTSTKDLQLLTTEMDKDLEQAIEIEMFKKLRKLRDETQS